MSRTLPTECEHGIITDWGDFAPEGSAIPTCEQCAAPRDAIADRIAVADEIVRLMATVYEHHYGIVDCDFDCLSQGRHPAHKDGCWAIQLDNALRDYRRLAEA